MDRPRRFASFFVSSFYVVFLLHQVGAELIFDCPGNKEVAVVEKDTSFPSLQDVCGGGAFIAFNGTVSNGDVSLVFSETDRVDHNSIEIYSTNFGSGAYEGYSIWGTSVDVTKIPCGTGYLVASVKDSGYEVAMKAERVAHVCNISQDVNVKLEADMDDMMTTPDYTMGHRVHLRADGYTSIMDQLQQQGHGIKKIELKNYGMNSLPQVTMDVAHVVLAYLRQSPSPTMPGGHCETPDYSILDDIVGWDNFTDEILGYGSREIHGLLDKPIDKESRICGDADLVIMYDALHTDLDNDTCDNFISVSVYVDCNYKTVYDEKCHVLPHESYGGSELIMTRGEYDMFFYEAWDNKWTEEGKWEMDRNRLMGFSRFHLLWHLLKDMPLEKDRGLCAVKEDFDREPIIVDQTDMPHLPENDTLRMRFDDLKNRVEYGYLDLSSLHYELENLRYEADMDYDRVIKAKKYGFAIGLNGSASFRHYRNMYHSYGMTVPANLSRAFLGGQLYHTALTAHHAIEVGSNSPETAMYGLTLTYGSLTLLDGIQSDINMDIARRTRVALNHVAKTLLELLDQSTTMSSTMVHCPHDRKISPDVQELLFLGAGFDGKMEKHMDPLERCRRALIFNYFRRGGARVHARDILKNMDVDPSYKNLAEKTPRMCRDHPALGHGSPNVMWEVDDRGRLMKGMYSPITDTVAWKPVAICRCDACHHGGYYHHNDYYHHNGYYHNNGYYHYTSPGHAMHHSTSWYMGSTPPWWTPPTTSYGSGGFA